MHLMFFERTIEHQVLLMLILRQSHQMLLSRHLPQNHQVLLLLYQHLMLI
jgi:hypothetical protein